MECCDTCRYKLRLVQYNYSHGGCNHTDMAGYVCMAPEYENEAIWMIGTNPAIGMCECYESKDRPDIMRDAAKMDERYDEKLRSIGGWMDGRVY